MILKMRKRGNAMYCERCGIIFEEKRCPVCGNQNVRPPMSDDLCFLTEREVMWAEMLEDVLKQNNIPCLTKNVLGAGLALKVGPMSERVRFYIPYLHLQNAKAIVDKLFPAPQEGNENEDQVDRKV